MKVVLFKGLGMDIRRLIFKKILSEASNFNSHLKFLCLGSKALSAFKLLYLCPEIILTISAFFWLAVWFHLFSTTIGLFVSWKGLLELLFIGFEHKLRIICTLHRLCSGPKKQLLQHSGRIEQPQIRFGTKWKIWTFFEPQLKKLKWLL